MILLVDNNDSFTYNVVELLRQVTDKKIDVIKSGNLNIDDVESYEKIIFSPGPSLPRNFPIMWDILDRYKTTKSILGICLGHQAICEYFGAKIEPLNHVLHGVDSTINCNSNSILFRGKTSMVVGRYHSWTVRKTPDSLTITATDGDGNIMAIEHSLLPIYGVQFHPESHISQEGITIFENFING